MFAAAQVITNRVERGEMVKAYQEARALVKLRSESAQAHFAMGYVARYAGMLDEARKECDTALRIDPGNYLFRSCAWAFMYMGDTRRAWEYVADRLWKFLTLLDSSTSYNRCVVIPVDGICVVLSMELLQFYYSHRSCRVGGHARRHPKIMRTGPSNLLGNDRVLHGFQS